MDADEPPRAHLPGDAVTPSLGINTAPQPVCQGPDDDGGERGDEDEVQPPTRSRKRSLKVERLRSNLDEFASQLASIRAKVAARSLSGRDDRASDACLPMISSKSNGGGVLPPPQPANTMAEHLRLPLLRRIDQATQQNMPPRDPFVAVDSMVRREAQQDKFRGDSSELAVQEQAAATALQDANRLDEQVRVAAVVFSKNERSWPFDERTRRYRELLELRKQAEEARAVADKERAKAQHYRSLLSDPYRGMKAMVSSPRTQLGPIEDVEYTWLWVLASPMPSLPFTPREETLQDSIEGEKELSTHVVYYIAPSAYTDRPASSPSAPEQDAARPEDRPPSDGWISCSNHGAFPAPRVIHTKSSIETWVMQGAGAGHMNDRYIICGTHDLVRKFKSSTGVELFRKRVPVMSALAQSLYDGPSEPETSSCAGEATDDPGGLNSVGGAHQTASVLPSALRSIEKDEHNFRSMQRIGAWLGMNEENERYRRMKEEAAQTNEDPANDASSYSDADTTLLAKRSPTKIKVQNERSAESSSSNDITQARPESCAPVCKEWVLFLKCTKREASKHAGEATPPLQKPGLGCPYRHYYISAEEKMGMTVWAQGKEYLLEKSVLSAIIAREAHIKAVKRLCSECMTAYQQNLRKDTEVILVKLLAELNHVRLLSIKVLEKIEAWRTHIRRLGFTRYNPDKDSSHEAAMDPATDTSTTSFLLGWSATITISTGKQLYKGSKAFVSRVKRFCRPEDATGKKEQHIVYLGYFKTRMEAERAYDEFTASEAR